MAGVVPDVSITAPECQSAAALGAQALLKSAAAELQSDVAVALHSAYDSTMVQPAMIDCHGTSHVGSIVQMPMLAEEPLAAQLPGGWRPCWVAGYQSGALEMPHTVNPAGCSVEGKTVIISGGMGALGSLVGCWAAAQHAQHIRLLGRSGHAASSLAALNALRSTAACVTMAMCDLAAADDYSAAARHLLASGQPCRRHFFHAGRGFEHH